MNSPLQSLGFAAPKIIVPNMRWLSIRLLQVVFVILNRASWLQVEREYKSELLFALWVIPFEMSGKFMTNFFLDF